LGQKFKAPQIIPFHPAMSPLQQYFPPSPQVKRLLQSLSRHVCETPHPDHPDWKPAYVKVYKVTHAIPSAEYLRGGMDPTHPLYLRAVYLGDYDPQGNLLPDNDPYLLYWQLPIFRPDLKSEYVVSYVHKHAGDPAWIFDPGKRVWVERF